MLPVARRRCIHLIAELGLTSNQSAASRRDAPDLTASTTRSRNSKEHGFGIDPPSRNRINAARFNYPSLPGNPDSTQPKSALAFTFSGPRSRVSRPDIIHVFRHGDASVYEAIFRWSMVRIALEQRGVRGQRLVRTDAFKHMDPTEEGAINYFLGLIACKLFASKLLDAPWISEPNDFDLRRKTKKRSGAVMTLAVGPEIGSGLRVI